jgi:hypothetical protein
MLVAAGAMLAASPVSVTLPQAVMVGSTTLPSGNYTISTLDEMGDGNDVFVIRSANGTAVTLQAQRIDSDGANKSELVLSKDGDTWHLGKLFIQGADSGFEFLNAK